MNWNDPTIQECIRRLDPETRYKYQKMGRHMYDTINYEDPETLKWEVETQIRLMIRDGLKEDDLDREDKQVYLNMKKASAEESSGTFSEPAIKKK